MTGVLADPVEEAGRLLDAAGRAGVVLRAIGGIAIAIRAPSVTRLRPPRRYHDIDLAGRGPRAPIEGLLTALGYEPARRFNTLHGGERLLFHDPSGRRIDVFLDTLRMCHPLPFAARLDVDRQCLPLADLALTKLQIVEGTERDAQDLAALFADHELTDDDTGIGLRRIERVTSRDWGWWRTVDGNLARLIDRWSADATHVDDDQALILRTATARATTLRTHLAVMPKSLGWQLRAAVGERMAWYDEPEEVR